MTRRRAERRPNFLFVGADKAGSSWLHSVLMTHPEIFLAPEKDLYFFDRYFGRGLDWYARHFEAATPEAAIIGEICHDYLYSPPAAERIAASLPDVRVMVCLREPVERAMSSYLNMRRAGWVSSDFATALDEHPHLLEHGRYGAHLARFAAHLPRERIYLGFFDDLQRNPQLFLDGVLTWLGVDRLVLSDAQHQPVRRASSARNETVARAVKAGAVLAREARLEKLVGALKTSSPVNRLLYRPLGRAEVESEPSATTRLRIQRELRADLEACERQFGVDLLGRWSWNGAPVEPGVAGTRHG